MKGAGMLVVSLRGVNFGLCWDGRVNFFSSYLKLIVSLESSLD